MADQGGNNNNVVMREYRKGNWTVNETMVLIEAKKMDDERRMKKSGGGESEGGGRGSKPTELRWKWVEDYCWRKGCLRSQNQCNDKWDNLMRDYKKVREYQRRNEGSSYWEMEKNERKEKNLPSNMLRHIYDRLEEVVEKKGGQRVVVSVAGGGVGGAIPNLPYAMDRPVTSVQVQQTSLALPPLLQQQHQLPPVPPISAAIPLPLPAPSPTVAPPPILEPPPLSYAQPALPPMYDDSSDSDTSEYSDSPAKRRRRSSGGGTSTGGATASGGAANNEEVGSAISRSASIIAEAIQASEENEDRRHRDLVSLHEKRLQIEQSKTEINQRGIDGLVDAINKLANSIFALASHKNKSQSAPK